jgi:hypothetical protein
VSVKKIEFSLEATTTTPNDTGLNTVLSWRLTNIETSFTWFERQFDCVTVGVKESGSESSPYTIGNWIGFKRTPQGNCSLVVQTYNPRKQTKSKQTSVPPRPTVPTSCKSTIQTNKQKQTSRYGVTPLLNSLNSSKIKRERKKEVWRIGQERERVKGEMCPRRACDCCTQLVLRGVTTSCVLGERSRLCF